MDLVQTYTVLQQVLAAELNSIQTRALGLRAADSNNDLLALPEGMLLRHWQFSGDVLTNTLTLVDGSLDYRDREVLFFWRGGTTANTRPGQANDHLYSESGSVGVLTVQDGYSGTGARDAGGVNPPSVGNPPVQASGVSWVVQIVTNLWLYCHPTTFKLLLFNNTGAAMKDPHLLMFWSEKTGKRP